MKKTPSQTDLQMLINNKIYTNYLDRLKVLATSIFTWEGLDEVVGFGANDFLEEILYNEGKACFIKDSKLGYMVLHVNPNGTFNFLNVPTKVTAWSIGYSKTFDTTNIIYIKNNVQSLPTINTLELFAYQLWNASLTIDINVNAQKTPWMLEGDDKNLLTLKNLYMKISGNEPAITVRKNMDMKNATQVLKTDAPIVFDKLTDYKHDVWNEMLTFLGINNANTDKKERLITNEVDANNEVVTFYLNCFYTKRKEACKNINDKFFNGKEKIKIKINTEKIKALNLTINNEGIENGKIYNNNSNIN